MKYIYDIRWLAHVARAGLEDLLPAVQQAFNADTTDDRLEMVYGHPPRQRIVLLGLAGFVAGALIGWAVAGWQFAHLVNWPAFALGAVHAVLVRRYLFSGQAGEHDFPWLAASMVPAVLLLMLASLVLPVWPSAVQSNADMGDGIGSLLVAITDAIGVAAVFAIAVATLCYSRKWVAALINLAVRLLLFKIAIWVTVLVLLEIGIVGPILAGILRGLFGIEIPSWLPDLADQLTYFALMSMAYLAVIGATWTVCRGSFAALLQSGEVNILDGLAKLANQPRPKSGSKPPDPD